MTRQEKVAYWTRQVKDQAGSGLSVRQYCAQAGIAVGTLQYWRRRLGVAHSSRQRGVADFLPVRLAPAGSIANSVEIQLLSGRRLSLSGPLDPAWLQTLVQVLEGPCG